MKRSVGPLTARPATSGLTATTGARRGGDRLAHPGHGEDRADRDHRVRGADHDRLGGGERLEHLGRRRGARRSPRARPPRSAASPRSRIRNSCSPRQPAGVRTRVRTGCSHIGSTRARDAERPRDLGLGGGQRAALGEEVGPVEAGGEVAVGEPEPARARRARSSRSWTVKRVVADPPAALLVDLAGEPVGDQVGVGGDVERRGPRCRRRCWRSPRGRRRAASCMPGGELRPAGAAGEQTTVTLDRGSVTAQWSPSGRPGDPDPGVGLVAGVDRDQHRGQLLDDPRHLERPGVDRAQPGDLLDQPRDPRLVGLAVAAERARPRRARRRGRRGSGR